MADHPSEPPSKRKCLGADCGNDAEALQCPTCLKMGMSDSYFCSQDCFKRNWTQHKLHHKAAQGKTQNGITHHIIPPRVGSKPDPVTGFYNPFPTYSFTGPVRPVYPLSAMRTVPKSIARPDYAETGISKSERRLDRAKVDILDAKGQEAMRKVCRLARQVLDIVAAELKPGVTTDYLDERILLGGDILNLDISLYHEGYHADVNETYYVGDRAKADPDSVRVVETARECLDKAIKLVRPGTPIREFGNVIEKHAKSRNCSVVATWGGHGINTNFHPPPWIPHYGQKHTLLVTETGVEVLTAANENSPGGPVPMPTPTNGSAKTNGASKA
ncbi:hypothetical protein DL764_006632 [Monosporascus ibericus]|uniref:C6H2-type domain-containing protein n=1 Tax=Monosporascus ibericus TaxID=155417 RepID=A0A4Q4T489_9PEZI|nr:hypothetical protein DL764_006632 [Monosporascus ibericus]